MDWRVARLDPNGPLLGSTLKPLPLYQAIYEDLPEVPQLPENRRAQEAMLISDLLGVLRGCEGSYICTSPRRPREWLEPTSVVGRMCGITFDICPGIDSGIAGIVDSIVGIAQHHIQVMAYAQCLSTLELGQVNHALAEGLRNLSHRFLEHVSLIERDLYLKPDFTLNTFTMLLQPYAVPLEHAAGLIDSFLLEAGFIKNTDAIESAYSPSKLLRGGRVLYILAQRMYQFRGSADALELYAGLLELASGPFLDMLSNWVGKGLIHDPFQEFMVREKLSASDVTRAQSRFELRAGYLPLKLSTPELARKVLQAGEYLNIVREFTGKPVASGDVEVDSFASIEDPALSLQIDHAYQRANKALLKLLLDKRSLVNRVQSLKHYFFFDNNDFFELFLETASNELQLKAEVASTTRLQYALDLALAQPGSRSSGEAYADEVKVGLASRNLTDELLSILEVGSSGSASASAGTGTYMGSYPGEDLRDQFQSSGDIKHAHSNSHGNSHSSTRNSRPSRIMPAHEALVLDFDIPFPQSLIIDHGSMQVYKYIFRNLLRIKLADRSLADAWTQSVKVDEWRKVSTNPKIQAWKRSALNLRGKMQAVVRDILYYCTADVIERNSAAFLAKIDSISTVDELHREHRFYMDQCIKECLLTDLRFLATQRDILQVASHYGRFLTNVGPELASLSAYDKHDGVNGQLEGLSSRLADTERAFLVAVDNFLAELDEASNTLSVPALVMRIQASMVL